MLSLLNPVCCLGSVSYPEWPHLKEPVAIQGWQLPSWVSVSVGSPVVMTGTTSLWSWAPLGTGASICQSSCVVYIGSAQQPAGINALGSAALWYVAVCLISPQREQMDSYGA